MRALSFARRLGRAGLAAAIAVVLQLPAPALAHEAAGHAQHAKPAGGAAAAWARMLGNKAPLAVSAAFDGAGRLWLARVVDGHIELQSSTDAGRSFTAAVRVNAVAQHIAAHGDDRPKLAFTGDGAILVAWTENLDSPPFASHVWLARSEDGGRSFAPPRRLNGDDRAISHGFAEIATAGDRVWAVWLDRRDNVDARARAAAYKGTALYTSASTDGGRSFGAERKLADNVCECCRLAISAAPDGVPLLLWRHIFADGVRDHALTRLDADAGKPPLRATSDDWRTDACPHHGPALSSDGGRVHLAWFTGAAGKAGLWYRNGDGNGFGVPLALGDPDNQPSHPQVRSVGRRLVLVWKEFDGQRSLVRSIESADAGATWAAARTLAATGGNSDHPQLIGRGHRIYLAWNTADEGFSLREITEGEGR